MGPQFSVLWIKSWEWINRPQATLGKKKKNRREYIPCRILLNSFLNVCICVLGCGVKCLEGYSPLDRKESDRTKRLTLSLSFSWDKGVGKMLFHPF